MTAAPAATQPSALERYKNLQEQYRETLIEENESLEMATAWSDAGRPRWQKHVDNRVSIEKKRIAILAALRDVLVERLNEGQAKIYTKRTIDTPSPATADMEEKFVTLLHEYEAVTKELHSLAPQLAVEAYLTSLTTQPKAHSV